MNKKRSAVQQQRAQSANFVSKPKDTRRKKERPIPVVAAKKRRRGVVTGMVAATVIVLAVVVFIYYRSRQNRQPLRNHQTSTQEARPLRRAIDQYLSGRQPDQWLLTSEQAEGNDFPFLRNLMRQVAARLENTLKTYENLPEVAEQRQMFAGKFYVGFYASQFGGTSRHVFRSKPDENPFNDPSSIEVVLYAQGHQNAPRVKNQLAKYDHDWGSVDSRRFKAE
jgi:hypothetical protein